MAFRPVQDLREHPRVKSVICLPLQEGKLAALRIELHPRLGEDKGQILIVEGLSYSSAAINAAVQYPMLRTQVQHAPAHLQPESKSAGAAAGVTVMGIKPTPSVHGSVDIQCDACDGVGCDLCTDGIVQVTWEEYAQRQRGE